jgi:zinc transport system substrate-binding protein
MRWGSDVQVLALIVAAACAPTQTAAPTQPLDVVTTSLPADWLVEQLSQGLPVSRRLIIPTGEDPPAWRPTGEDIAGLLAADLIVANGAGYERWMDAAGLPQSRVVDSAALVPALHLAPTEHEHGSQGSHPHAGLDPHTFTDPLAYGQQLAQVADALSRSLPDDADDIESRRAVLQAALQSIADDLVVAARPLLPHTMATNHPSFHHLARRAGLHVTDLPLDPVRSATAAEASAVTAWASKASSPILIWEAAPSDAAAGALPPGVASLILDPLEQPGANGRYDYLLQSRSNILAIHTLTATLAESKPPPP